MSLAVDKTHRIRKLPSSSDLTLRVALVVGPVVLMWLITGVNAVLFGGRWLASGVRAHDPSGLWPNLLIAPLLHVGMAHLLANTIPFLVLGGLVALRSKSQFVAVTIAGVIGSGLAAWVLGPSGSVHVGASGVVFAYFGWLIARGIRERSLLAIVLALVAGLLYGGVLWGLSPFQVGVSWEGHLGGLLAGTGMARAWPSPRSAPAPRQAV